MSIIESYMNSPYDLSGSMSKNRFRNEILWGLKRILELYKLDKKFTVVFDYKCDVEVHLEDGFEFYQLKTQNDNGSYTVRKLIGKNKNGDSVLGKLYILKFNEKGEEQDEIKVAVVSNAPLSAGKKVHTDSEALALGSIDSDVLNDIRINLTKELTASEEVKLLNTYFIRTSIDLINPEKTLIGELALFFEETFGTEPKKINSLYRVLSSEIFNKACYELTLETYEEILSKKGIEKSELSNVLNQYVDKTDMALTKATVYIEENYKDNFKSRFKMKRALNSVLINLTRDKILRGIELEIVKFLTINLDNLSDNDLELIDKIGVSLEYLKPIETSDEEFRVLILLTLKRYEEGVYERSNY